MRRGIEGPNDQQNSDRPGGRIYPHSLSVPGLLHYSYYMFIPRIFRSANLQKVAILGASGGVGQQLSLLMKKSLYVTDLSLYDIASVDGIAADLSHIDTHPKVTGYTGQENLSSALVGTKVVLIVAGLPSKPGMSRGDLFDKNAPIVADLARACGNYCPEAMICLITNPINSTVPIAAEILKREKAYNPKRLFGVTTLDIIRTNTFIAQAKDLDVSKVSCPVVGGHSGNTIVPIFSQCNPTVTLPRRVSEELVARIQNAGTDVVNAKAGKGSATLAMAYAGARFANSLLHAMRSRAEIVECAFVESEVAETDFFASPVLLGPNGVEKVFGIGNVNKYETELLKIAIPELKKNIQRGKDFAAVY
nr:malate dehydrogenase [Hymenolepis microstoma]